MDSSCEPLSHRFPKSRQDSITGGCGLCRSGRATFVLERRQYALSARQLGGPAKVPRSVKTPPECGLSPWRRSVLQVLSSASPVKATMQGGAQRCYAESAGKREQLGRFGLLNLTKK